uniref:Uncharacterized protein n=1 Tax=Anopheles minimus TaxID=112268 RepID=A0A182WPF6_9DIPT
MLRVCHRKWPVCKTQFCVQFVKFVG